MSGSGQPVVDTSGIAVIKAKSICPNRRARCVRGRIVGGDGFHTGTMFAALEQAPFLGWHWDLREYDSQTTSNLLGDSMNTVTTPDISTRGFSGDEAKTATTSFRGRRHTAKRPAGRVQAEAAAKHLRSDNEAGRRRAVDF